MPPSRRQADDSVTLTLAHPLTAEQVERLGAEKKDLNVGDQIQTSRANARAIIAAGYAQVDPENHDEVRKALGGGALPGEVVAPDETPKTATITSAAPSAEKPKS